jgi:hypothetical protein
VIESPLSEFSFYLPRESTVDQVDSSYAAVEWSHYGGLMNISLEAPFDPGDQIVLNLAYLIAAPGASPAFCGALTVHRM